MHTFEARGIDGALKKGYQVAARFSRWHLDNGGRLEATVSARNEFWLEQEGLTLELAVGQTRKLIWRTFDVLDRGNPFVFRVIGSPEQR